MSDGFKILGYSFHVKSIRCPLAQKLCYETKLTSLFEVNKTISQSVRHRGDLKAFVLESLNALFLIHSHVLLSNLTDCNQCSFVKAQ